MWFAWQQVYAKDSSELNHFGLGAENFTMEKNLILIKKKQQERNLYYFEIFIKR